MWGNAGLYGESVQDGLAKRMDGFDPWPMIIIKDFSKQATGALHHILRRRLYTHILKIFGQRLGTDNGPVA